ncbi:MAG: hypothetical protein V1662_06145 [Candidatus Omnitrophota bacterium]
MEILLLTIKDFIFILAVAGIVFHTLTLKNAGIANKIEQEMIREFGIKKKVFYWLEENRMTLHERLFNRKAYHIAAIICLLFIVWQTIRVSAFYTPFEKTAYVFIPKELPGKGMLLPR